MNNTILAVLIFVTTVAAVMTGGFKEQDASKPEYQTTAWKAVKGVNDPASNNGPYYFVPIKVLKVQTQVVAGLSTNLEVLFGQSTCKRGELEAHQLTEANCQAKPDGSRAIYKINVWEKPWENFEQFNVEKIRDVSASEQF